ncbi:MAG: Hpt domain-containing protein, partial [Blastocatellia bacterium]
MNNQQFEPEVINDFIDEANGYLPEILQGIERYLTSRSNVDSLEDAYRFTHTISGTAASLGFMPLSDAASQLEEVLMDLRHGPLTISKESAIRLRQTALRLASHLNEIASQYATDDALTTLTVQGTAPYTGQAYQAPDQAAAYASPLPDPLPYAATAAMPAPVTAGPGALGDLLEIPVPSSDYAGPDTQVGMSMSFADAMSADAMSADAMSMKAGPAVPRPLPSATAEAPTAVALFERMDDPAPWDARDRAFSNNAPDDMRAVDAAPFVMAGVGESATRASDDVLVFAETDDAGAPWGWAGASSPEVAEELAEVFALEARDHLHNLKIALEALKKEPANEDLLLEIRRSAHSLKGAAAMVGIEAITTLGNRMEDFLDWLYQTAQRITPEMQALLSRTTSVLEKMSGRQNTGAAEEELCHDYDEMMLSAALADVPAAPTAPLTGTDATTELPPLSQAGRTAPFAGVVPPLIADSAPAPLPAIAHLIETPIKTPMEMPAEIKAVAQVAQAPIPGPSVAPPPAPMAFDHAAPSVASVVPVHQEVALVHEAPET